METVIKQLAIYIQKRDIEQPKLALIDQAMRSRVQSNNNKQQIYKFNKYASPQITSVITILISYNYGKEVFFMATKIIEQFNTLRRIVRAANLSLNSSRVYYDNCHCIFQFS